MPVHRFVIIAVLAAVPLTAAVSVPACAAPAAAQPEVTDVFTPVVATPIGDRHVAVAGTDGLVHVIYELELTNTKRAPATVKQIDVIDANKPDRVLASWSGSELLDHLRTLQPSPAESAVIPADSSLMLFVELALKPGAVPSAIAHRFHLTAAPNPGPKAVAAPMTYTVSRIEVSRAPLPVLEPPLRGAGWVAVNGCCNSGIVHRGSLQGMNGGMYDAQRFAIDWMRLNPQGEFVHGDPSVAGNYVDYGAKVYAVADGTVVEILDDLPDQPPGKLPDPASITLQTVDGNHVILDIGHGLYAFYAHLKKGSIIVHRGEHIKAGTFIGELGNTGNTSGPHLHFQVMDGPSALGSQGLPYVIDHFELTGQVDVKAFDKSDVLTGHWGKRLTRPVAEKARFPLNLNVVDFTMH